MIPEPERVAVKVEVFDHLADEWRSTKRDYRLAPGERARIVREELAKLVAEFENALPMSWMNPEVQWRPNPVKTAGAEAQHKRDIEFWRTKLAALGVASNLEEGT